MILRHLTSSVAVGALVLICWNAPASARMDEKVSARSGNRTESRRTVRSAIPNVPTPPRENPPRNPPSTPPPTPMAGGHQTPGSSVSFHDWFKNNAGINRELRAGRDALNHEHEDWHDAHHANAMHPHGDTEAHRAFHQERDRKFGELNDHINELRRSLYHPDATSPTMPPVQSPPSPPVVRPPPDLDRPPTDRPPLRRLD